jgi:hypothetical protein
MSKDRFFLSICKSSIMANTIVFITEYSGLNISIDLFHDCSAGEHSFLWHSISKIFIESMQFLFSFSFIRRENHVFYFLGQL